MKLRGATPSKIEQFDSFLAFENGAKLVCENYMNFKYSSGELIREGDRIKVISQPGVVQEIILCQTQAEKDLGCFETGGVFLAFDNGDLQLWPWVDEDLVFLKRS